MTDDFGFAMDEPIPTPDTPLSTEERTRRLEAVRAYFAGDLYATQATGIRIDDALPGWAQVSMDLVPQVQNAKGGVMGGALFTMADFVASIADWEEGTQGASVDGSIQFASVAKGTRLVATAIAQRRGRSLGFYRVRIEDDLGTLVATALFTIMHRIV